MNNKSLTHYFWRIINRPAGGLGLAKVVVSIIGFIIILVLILLGLDEWVPAKFLWLKKFIE